MVPFLTHRRLILPPASAAAALMGGLTALGVLLLPSYLLEGAVNDSGIVSLIGAAEPPLGFTARMVLALGLGGLVAGFFWAAAYLLLGDGKRARAASEREAIPLIRRGDAHPDAPPRRPLFAERELGTPFLDIRGDRDPDEERAIPADLDQPLSAFDPFAIPEEPREPVRAVAPLPRPQIEEPVAPAPMPRPQLLEPGERLETFPLSTPPVEPAAEPIAEPEPNFQVARSTEATIQSLLERLERGVAQREAARRNRLGDTLGELRQMATQR